MVSYVQIEGIYVARQKGKLKFRSLKLIVGNLWRLQSRILF